GLINEKFNWGKEEIERFEYQGFTRTLYKYTYTFTFDGETGEDCAIFIGSESVNGNAAFFMFTEPMLQEGSKALPWRPNPQDIKYDIQILSSEIDQQAKEIALRVKEEKYETDMDDMNIRVTEAESSITQNADNIKSKVEKNGVISTINQSPEEIEIDAERVSIDGDLVVENGKVYIKDGIITNEMIAGDAKIDGAKIGNATITNAKIANVNADKIKSGILDTEKAIVRVKRGKQAIQMDDTGFVTVDSNGTERIHIGIRNLGGKGQSDPSTIRFFSGNGSKSAGVGMNVNDTFVVGT